MSCQENMNDVRLQNLEVTSTVQTLLTKTLKTTQLLECEQSSQSRATTGPDNAARRLVPWHFLLTKTSKTNYERVTSWKGNFSPIDARFWESSKQRFWISTPRSEQKD